MTKKKITISDIMLERKKITDQVLEGKAEPISIATSVYFFNKKSKRVSKAVKALNFYNLVKYVKVESYLIRRSDNELDFIRADAPSPNFLKTITSVLKYLDNCVLKYLASSENFSVSYLEISGNLALIEINEWGYFIVSKKLIKKFSISKSDITLKRPSNTQKLFHYFKKEILKNEQ